MAKFILFSQMIMPTTPLSEAHQGGLNIAFHKPPLPISEQIELLQERGLIIDDPSLASHFLINIGYFRLLSYFKSFTHDAKHFFKTPPSDK